MLSPDRGEQPVTSFASFPAAAAEGAAAQPVYLLPAHSEAQSPLPSSGCVEIDGEMRAFQRQNNDVCATGKNPNTKGLPGKLEDLGAIPSAPKPTSAPNLEWSHLSAVELVTTTTANVDLCTTTSPEISGS